MVGRISNNGHKRPWTDIPFPTGWPMDSYFEGAFRAMNLMDPHLWKVMEPLPQFKFPMDGVQQSGHAVSYKAVGLSDGHVQEETKMFKLEGGKWVRVSCPPRKPTQRSPVCVPGKYKAHAVQGQQTR